MLSNGTIRILKFNEAHEPFFYPDHFFKKSKVMVAVRHADRPASRFLKMRLFTPKPFGIPVF